MRLTPSFTLRELAESCTAERLGIDKMLSERVFERLPLQEELRVPFNGHVDEFGISHVQRSNGWIETTWNNLSDPGAFAAAAAEEQEGGEPPPQELGWSSA